MRFGANILYSARKLFWGSSWFSVFKMPQMLGEMQFVVFADITRVCEE